MLRFVLPLSALSLVLHADPSTEAPLTFQALERIVRENKITKLEELLARLPNDLRSNFTLMEQTKSSQEASSEKPRAILFGKDAKFVVAFDAEGQSLETMEVDRKTEQPIFRAITFDGKGPPRFSGDNPDRCKKCHGQPPGMFWSSYDTWTGAYGVRFDAIFDDQEKNYSAFRKLAETHSRYKTLVYGDGPWAPYNKPGTSSKLAQRPNERFAHRVIRVEARAIAARIRLSEHFSRWGALMAFEMLPCGYDTAATLKALGSDSDTLQKKSEAIPKTPGFDWGKFGHEKPRERYFEPSKVMSVERLFAAMLPEVRSKEGWQRLKVTLEMRDGVTSYPFDSSVYSVPNLIRNALLESFAPRLPEAQQRMLREWSFKDYILSSKSKAYVDPLLDRDSTLIGDVPLLTEKALQTFCKPLLELALKDIDAPNEGNKLLPSSSGIPAHSPSKR